MTFMVTEVMMVWYLISLLLGSINHIMLSLYPCNNLLASNLKFNCSTVKIHSTRSIIMNDTSMKLSPSLPLFACQLDYSVSIYSINIHPGILAWIIENAYRQGSNKAFCPFRINFRECRANIPFQQLNANVYTVR